MNNKIIPITNKDRIKIILIFSFAAVLGVFIALLSTNNI
jgi:hypothetical protein